MIRALMMASLCALALAAGGCATTTTGPPGSSLVETPGEPLRGVHHVGITVSDIDATIAFYRQSVTFDVVSRYRVPASAFPREIRSAQGMVDVALIRTPTLFLQLMDFAPGQPAAPHALPIQGPGYTHICFQSPSGNPGYARFRSAGLAMVTPGDEPVDVGGYGVTYAYGRDPDGTMIEMEQLDRPRRGEADWVSHVAIVTPDIERMVGFYQRIIGYAPHRRVTTSNPRLMRIANLEQATIHGAWFATRNLELEIWNYVDPPTPQPAGPRPIDQLGHALIAFEVTDLAAERRRLRALGVRMIGEPVAVRGWRIQYARDPDGNLIAVQQNRSANPEESIEPLRWLDPASYVRRTQ